MITADNIRFRLIGGRLVSLFCCLLFFLATTMAQSQQEYSRTDSLLALLPDKTGIERVDLLLEISQSRWYVSFDESLEYANQAYQLASRINYPEGRADALNRIGNVHYFLRNYDDVIENYNLAFEIADSLNDYRRIGIYLNNIGLLYREMDQYEISADFLTRALKAKEQFGDRELLISTLSNLGHVYRDMGRYSLALEYFVRQLDILGERGVSGNISRVHRRTGDVFFLQKRYSEALRHYFNALSISREINDSVEISASHNLIGKAYLEMNQMENALEQINLSIEFANAISSDQLIRNGLQLLYEYYKKTGDPETAYDYLVKYSNLKDSLRSQNISNRTDQLETIFETKKQNNQIELLQKETEIQELYLSRQNNIKNSLLALAVILTIFIIIIAIRFIKVQQTNKLLRQKIGELERTNDKLSLSALSLEQLNATKNRFFSIIAHDLKNPFNALLGFSEIISSSFNILKEAEIREYIGIVHQSSQNLYKLLENLLKWSAAQTGTMHFLPEKFDLTSLIYSEINFFRIGSANKKISIKPDMPDELILNSDKLLLSSVIRNLIDNAIKFTPQGGEINIKASKTNGEVIVEVSDNGIGIPEELQPKIFKMDGDINRKGTNNEEGGGLGLILSKELIEKIGGRIGVRSEHGRGSTFWITIPG